MGYDGSYLGKIEKGVKPLTDDVIIQFKKALNAPMLPLTDEEEILFKQQLYDWKDMISQGDIEEAKEMQHQISRCASLLESKELKNLYDVFLIIFYRVTKNDDVADEEMKKLKMQEMFFNDESSYWYNRQIGVHAHRQLRYKDALQAFLRSEKKGEKLSLNNGGLYYNISYCLTVMGFSSIAIDYISKAQEYYNVAGITSNNIHLKSFLSENYYNTGRNQQALQLLKGCLQEEQNSKFGEATIGITYRHIAIVNYQMNDLVNALKNIEISITRTKENKIAYADSIYWKAKILDTEGNTKEAISCLEKGIIEIEPNTIKYVLLKAKMQSLRLNEETSLPYLDNTAFPMLEEYGYYLNALDLYEAIYNHFKVTNKRKAWPYATRIIELSEKLRKGVL